MVGGGAVGVTVALELAKRDAEVTLFEAGEVAAGSSGRAAGVCYDAFADRIDAELADRSLARFLELSGAGEFEFTDCPYVWLAREGDERRASAAREGVERMCVHDRDVSLLSASELESRFPALAREAGAELRTNALARLRAGPAVETGDDTEAFDAVLVDDGTEPVEWDPDDWDRDADDWFVQNCAGYERRALGRELSTARAWAGICTATPDGHPLLGSVPGVAGVYVATGWQGHWFMRAPAVGERGAAEILGEAEGVRVFAPGRFDGDEAFEVVEGMAVERDRSPME